MLASMDAPERYVDEDKPVRRVSRGPSPLSEELPDIERYYNTVKPYLYREAMAAAALQVAFASNAYMSDVFYVQIAIVLILIGFFVKFGVAPFHF